MTRVTLRRLGAAMVLVVLGAAACVTPLKKDEELAAILSAYQRQNTLVTERRQAQTAQGIKTLTVTPAPGSLVSADLEGALLSVVVRRILDESKIAHFVQTPVPFARVTARFERLPLARALQHLVEPYGLNVIIKDDVLVLAEAEPAPSEPGRGPAATVPPAMLPPPATATAPPPQAATPPLQEPRLQPQGPLLGTPGPPVGTPGMPPGGMPPMPGMPLMPGMPFGGFPPPGPEGPTTTREVALRHLDLEGAQRLLDSLFPRSPFTGSRRVEFGHQSATNSVTLLGAPADVTRAAAILRQADRENAHIVIEALVVEFDANAFERLATNLVNFANAQFSGLATAIGALAGTALTFTYTRGANNTLAYTAIIDVLVSTQQARLISRPYLAAMSGRSANIQITRDRYVVVQTAVAGATITSAAPVTSGIIMKITPVALPDGRIQMTVDVEDSTFVTPGVNVTADVDKNRAATTMQVESGQAIIIGGLVLNQRTGSNAGLPWLRHVPLLNLATANQQMVERKQEVMIFLTPHLWTPDLGAPLTSPDSLTIKDLDGRLGNIERFKAP